MGLSNDQVRRYSRHVLLPDVGGTGQAKWLAGAVRVPARLDAAAQAAVVYLAAAGVGRIVVEDRGEVAAPGPLFLVADVGRPVAEAAAARVAALNPDARVVASAEGAVDLTIDRAETLPEAVAAGATAARRALRQLVRA